MAAMQASSRAGLSSVDHLLRSDKTEPLIAQHGPLGRFSAAGLFILNAVAVISYADLSEAGINQHLSWGILLGVLLILSRGQWSADAWLEKRLKVSGKT